MMESLPSCQSMRVTQLKLCVCVGRVRSTPPSSTPGHDGSVLSTERAEGSGIAGGNCVRAKGLQRSKLWLPGKQAESVAMPFGVGTLPALV